MRSFTPKTFLLASLLTALPLAGAYARSNAFDEVAPTVMQGSHLAALLDQAHGVMHGIVEAREGHEINAATARTLEMQAAGVTRTAQRVAAENHGKVPTVRYDKLLKRLDTIDQGLLSDTGSGFNIGDGSDGGTYPNG